MSKKFISACLVLLAVTAVALPSAAASATPELTEPTGTALAVGAHITGTLTGGNLKLWNTSKTQVLLECTTATTTGELLKNTGGVVEANITSARFGGTGGTTKDPGAPPECTGVEGMQITPENLPWCLRLFGASYTLDGGNCTGTAKNLKYTMVTTNFGSCTYESTSNGLGSYVTDATTQDAVITIQAVNPSTLNNGLQKREGSILCPSSFQWEVSFTLETDESPTAKPIYIS